MRARARARVREREGGREGGRGRGKGRGGGRGRGGERGREEGSEREQYLSEHCLEMFDSLLVLPPEVEQYLCPSLDTPSQSSLTAQPQQLHMHNRRKSFNISHIMGVSCTPAQVRGMCTSHATHGNALCASYNN